ncbi:MAG: hypothetical protein GY757_43715 [bacterium]|nr:hypothetical protein [bacterium]
MKLFFKKVSLFILLVAIVISALNVLGLKAGDIYKDGASIICESKRDYARTGPGPHRDGETGAKNPERILVMGTSRIMAGFRPRVFDKLSGGTTLTTNFALPALPISAYYFLLKDYLKTNPPPATILLELKTIAGMAMFHRYANQGISGLGEILSYMRNISDKNVAANYFLPIRMYKYYIARYLSNKLRHPAALAKNRKRNRNIVKKMLEDRGYYFIAEQALFPDKRLPEGYGLKKGKLPDTPPQLDPFADPYVEKFFDLAQREKIPVQLIQPVYRVDQCLQYKEVSRQYRAVMQRYSVVTTGPGGWKLKFYKNKYFADLVHLNPEGAEIYTGEIYREFAASGGKTGGNQ